MNQKSRRQSFLKTTLATVAAIALLLPGCTTAGDHGGTAAISNSGPVQGRDLGRGGATSGGLSSVDPSGNAADYSVYDAKHPNN